jgi:hypothetical protein
MSPAGRDAIGDDKVGVVMRTVFEDQYVMTPYAAPGTDTAHIRALELRIKWLAEEIADLRRHVNELQAERHTVT